MARKLSCLNPTAHRAHYKQIMTEPKHAPKTPTSHKLANSNTHTRTHISNANANAQQLATGSALNSHLITNAAYWRRGARRGGVAKTGRDDTKSNSRNAYAHTDLYIHMLLCIIIYIHMFLCICIYAYWQHLTELSCSLQRWPKKQN